jgi:hypothetical protein
LAKRRMSASAPDFLGFFTSTCFTLEANRSGLERVRRNPRRSFELMVHPAMPQDAQPTADSAPLSPEQEKEVGELRKLREFFERPAS